MKIKNMRILGIDYGLKKIGLAISEGELAEPLGVIKIANSKKQIVNICQREKIKKIVIGIPEGKIREKVKQFAKDLAKMTGLAVVYQPETLTSKDAIAKMIEAGRKRKFRRQKEDAIAAAIILQSWIDKN